MSFLIHAVVVCCATEIVVVVVVAAAAAAAAAAAVFNTVEVMRMQYAKLPEKAIPENPFDVVLED